MNISPKKVYTKVNKTRKENKMNELIWNQALYEAAYERAKEIHETGNWSHKRKDGSDYSTAIKGLDTLGVDLVGENLGRKFKNSDSMIKAWMKSPGHKKNIMQDFTDTGVATYKGTTVQLFGRKKK